MLQPPGYITWNLSQAKRKPAESRYRSRYKARATFGGIRSELKEIAYSRVIRNLLVWLMRAATTAQAASQSNRPKPVNARLLALAAGPRSSRGQPTKTAETWWPWAGLGTSCHGDTIVQAGGRAFRFAADASLGVPQGQGQHLETVFVTALAAGLPGAEGGSETWA